MGESSDGVVFLGGAPPPDVTVPAAVTAVAGGRKVLPVWENEEALTFAVGEGSGRCFIKWAPAGSRLDLAAEADRMVWAGQFHSVPRVLARGQDDTGSWLVTAALPGHMAVDARWKADPSTAVAGIGRGLRAMHEALPADRCPFSWSAGERLAAARREAAAGRLNPATWDPSHQGLTVAAALERAAAIPPADKLVVCHGDACAPNTILAEDGRWSGHVDLGALGTADRWADLAVASWSAGWNFGHRWELALLDAYGIDPDPERITYYRLLWDLG